MIYLHYLRRSSIHSLWHIGLIPYGDNKGSNTLNMKVGDAVKIAKKWIADVYSDEKIENIGLEEINFNHHEGAWKVTIGFSRPWDDIGITGIMGGLSAIKRSYKVVVIDDSTGEINALSDRMS